jgi:hypothetical protein
MNSLGLDTIAGARLLQLKFGLSGVFQPDQAVIHEDRRARFIRVSDGAAIIRYWGDSHPVAVPLETLSLLPAGADARRVGPSPVHSRLKVRVETRRPPRHQPRRRPPLRP